MSVSATQSVRSVRPTRRAILAVGSAVAAQGALAACASGTSQPAVKTQIGGKVYVYARGDAFIVNLFKEQAKAFNEDYPGVQVEVELGPQDDFAKFQTLIAAGSPLDTAFLSDTTAGTAQRVAQPLIQGQEIYNNIISTELRAAWTGQKSVREVVETIKARVEPMLAKERA